MTTVYSRLRALSHEISLLETRLTLLRSKLHEEIQSLQPNGEKKPTADLSSFEVEFNLDNPNVIHSEIAPKQPTLYIGAQVPPLRMFLERPDYVRCDGDPLIYFRSLSDKFWKYASREEFQKRVGMDPLVAAIPGNFTRIDSVQSGGILVWDDDPRIQQVFFYRVVPSFAKHLSVMKNREVLPGLYRFGSGPLSKQTGSPVAIQAMSGIQDMSGRHDCSFSYDDGRVLEDVPVLARICVVHNFDGNGVSEESSETEAK